MPERWYRVVVGDPLLDADPFGAVVQSFQEGYPGDTKARLVTRLESQGSLQCVAVAYLSPAAAELAHELGADPVPPPDWLGATRT